MEIVYKEDSSSRAGLAGTARPARSTRRPQLPTLPGKSQPCLRPPSSPVLHYAPSTRVLSFSYSQPQPHSSSGPCSRPRRPVPLCTSSACSPSPLASPGLHRASPFPTARSRPFFLLSLKKRNRCPGRRPHLPHRTSAWQQAPWKQPALPLLEALGPWQASAAIHPACTYEQRQAQLAATHPPLAAGRPCSVSWSFPRPWGAPHCSSAVSAPLPQSSSPGLSSTHECGCLVPNPGPLPLSLTACRIPPPSVAQWPSVLKTEGGDLQVLLDSS